MSLTSMDSDSTDTGSPSLLNHLRKFRFQKRVHQDRDEKCNENSDNSPSGTQATVIPETPESQLGKANNDTEDKSTFSENSRHTCDSESKSPHNGDIQLTTEGDESPLIHNGTKKRRRIISIDSDDSNGADGSFKRTKVADDELACLTKRERCLRQLMSQFEKADVMEIQDALVMWDWDIDKTFNFLKENPPSTHGESNNARRSSSANFVAAVRGVVFDEEGDGNSSYPSSPREKPPPKPKVESKFKTFNKMSSQKTLKPEGEGAVLSRKNEGKKKRRITVLDNSDDDGDYKNESIYDSGDDSDGDNGDENVSVSIVKNRLAVTEFFNDATIAELMAVPSCSKKKAEAIVENRPYKNWSELVQKFETRKNLAPSLLNSAKDLLHTRWVVKRLMKRCQDIADKIENIVTSLVRGESQDSEGYIKVQPSILNQSMTLAPYQLIGLNWLALMHRQEVNGILADEMGLGKTIQAIAFLAYLHQQGENGPHVVVVPSSTLENWMREFELWCPSLTLLVYHGSQEDRRDLRYQILDGEVGDFNVLLATYHMVASNAEDRSLFKKLSFKYVIFDEAHMLKNMASQRYGNLMKINAQRKILLTGTPLQNNLVELMSLLSFVMPTMFQKKTDQIKLMFSSAAKDESNQSKFEKERVVQAKQIMRPFVLRRLKKDVLQQLPSKHEDVRHCVMTPHQSTLYKGIVETLSKEFKERQKADGMLMKLRRASNHPLLLRHYYDEEKLRCMAKLMLKEPTHRDANPDLIFEDMEVMSDFELHMLCNRYESVRSFRLEDEKILDSGKLIELDLLLKEQIGKGNRVLIFSQFTMVLDILEAYLNIRRHKWLRLDGSTSVQDRQDLIDKFNKDDSILAFLLSTRAGGLGINLTSANVVILHDLDFNPYNDKQAEDRCHRMGQSKEVQVVKLVSKDTIEEGILSVARDKLKLEKDVTGDSKEEDDASTSVAHLLKDALGC
ncbi:SWI/SNF-related matrix-associated actin-dependent regulator of chromatin subfamily A containing DEAD/H box 1-like [Ornithodoros turicata]|uniref:SWI/SNF-related matrix-associated actin-dependent regulator of chromatin subfamily A containing DEAD/H box 1-like n=1 Tax=Ornithodoros turicata TaxID=34597 RepID=UPI003139F2F9